MGSVTLLFYWVPTAWAGRVTFSTGAHGVGLKSNFFHWCPKRGPEKQLFPLVPKAWTGPPTFSIGAHGMGRKGNFFHWCPQQEASELRVIVQSQARKHCVFPLNNYKFFYKNLCIFPRKSKKITIY